MPEGAGGDARIHTIEETGAQLEAIGGSTGSRTSKGKDSRRLKTAFTQSKNERAARRLQWSNALLAISGKKRREDRERMNEYGKEPKVPTNTARSPEKRGRQRNTATPPALKKTTRRRDRWQRHRKRGGGVRRAGQGTEKNGRRGRRTRLATRAGGRGSELACGGEARQGKTGQGKALPHKDRGGKRPAIHLLKGVLEREKG